MPASVPIRGDSQKRVTVPIPQSVTELESSARKNFGSGRLQCFHRGVTQITSQANVNNIGDQDVIVVRRSSSATGPRGYDPTAMTTTHQSSYVKHEIERARTPRPRGAQTNGSPPAPFTGRSCYSGDYVAHTITPRSMPRPAGSNDNNVQPRGLEMTGCSTYRENYPRHELPKKEVPSRPRGATGLQTEPLPFKASSSYTQDYIKHPARPRSATGVSRGLPTNDLGPTPFAGNTTYADDYKKHNPATARAKIFKPTNQSNDQYPPPGFAGNSEYKLQYVKKEKPRLPYCYMEPEMKDR
mmetsp:Transcript_165039/g.292199  ORF Transcript_165039/g.292199 Transcript_165039/m.292199 type:complete len:298 (-) Transcript_165039:148-1041(-)